MTLHPAAPALALTDLSKAYRDQPAVTDLNLTVHAGETMGFLGPNGAGKTTTIRLLTGFLRPTRGAVHLFGHDMSQPHAAMQARARLGFVPDVAGLDPAATGARLLDELATLQGRPPVDRELLVDALELRRADLARPLGRLSRGTRQKVNIVQGLQHRPDLLILDEPTEGLDPLTKRALFDLLHATHSRGATIFFSSHVLSEVEELCDRVALIRRGRLVTVDSIDALRGRLQRRVTLELGTEPVDAHATLAAIPGVTRVEPVDTRWRLWTTDTPALIQALAELPLADLIIEQASLEDVFLQHYATSPGDARHDG
jgi:ABC-2 type transport system ATP-binding protein